MPRRALAVLSGIAREGCDRDAARCWRDRSPFQQPPIKTTERRKQRHRVAFSLDTFFWRRKRKYLIRGYENHIQITVAVATHIVFILRLAQDERSLLLISWFDKRTKNEINYLTRIPTTAPSSGLNTKISFPPDPAASTMPSDKPNFIFRGARLAKTTVNRPSRSSGL